jgi:hypothetical protein
MPGATTAAKRSNTWNANAREELQTHSINGSASYAFSLISNVHVLLRKRHVRPWNELLDSTLNSAPLLHTGSNKLHA